MDLLLANPIRGSTMVIEKTIAMLYAAVVIGSLTFAGVAFGALLGGLDMSMVNIAATCVLMTLVSLVFGSVALALSAATGRVRIATCEMIGLALVLWLMSTHLPLSDRLAAYAKWIP